MQEVSNPNYLRALGERIRTLRKQKNMTQLDVASIMDNYAEQIGRIERGEQNVSICTLKLIADALSVSMKELVDFEY